MFPVLSFIHCHLLFAFIINLKIQNLKFILNCRNKVSCATTAKLLLGVIVSAFGLVFVIFVMKCKFKIGFQMNMCYYM